MAGVAHQGRADEPSGCAAGCPFDLERVTLDTDSMALCVSQSTGTISIFRRGRLVADIPKPRSRPTEVF